MGSRVTKRRESFTLIRMDRKFAKVRCDTCFGEFIHEFKNRPNGSADLRHRLKNNGTLVSCQWCNDNTPPPDPDATDTSAPAEVPARRARPNANDHAVS